MGVLSMFNFPIPIQSSYLSFGIQKPSHVTNIHWKFHDFLPSSLRVIKVSHFTLRSEDSVSQCRIPKRSYLYTCIDILCSNDVFCMESSLPMSIKTDKTYVCHIKHHSVCKNILKIVIQDQSQHSSPNRLEMTWDRRTIVLIGATELNAFLEN